MRKLQEEAEKSAVLRNSSQSFLSIREKYAKYEYTDLAAHPAIVLLPYQVSIMSFFEYFRMGIPMFVPCIELLAKWQTEYTMLNEISWNCVHGNCKDPSAFPPHPASPHLAFDPNDVTNETSLAYWLGFADFYQVPHITYFESWDGLFVKVHSTDLLKIHKKMMSFNKEQVQALRADWADILTRALGKSPPLAQHRDNDHLSNQTWEESVLWNYPQVLSEVKLEC
ncbi:hypothetical protein ACHAWF_001960 [Thalassiosira exigua]